MSRQTKRTRTTSKKAAATSITIRQVLKEKDGVQWTTHLVQGWKEDGKWKRKQFKDRKDAERFAALKRIEVENTGRSQRMILTALTEEQQDQAVRAFDKLGGTYGLLDAVDFFLRHHRAPDYTITLDDAAKIYLDSKERDGLREKSIKGIQATLALFSAETDNAEVHTITAPQIDAFLSGLRGKDGMTRATRRTWEIHRGALNGFFKWSASADKSTNRPFTFENPVDAVRKFTARQVREEQAQQPVTTSPVDVQHLFTVLMRWRGGSLIPAYALLYFAGVRPLELKRLAPRFDELVNLRTRTIRIPANVAKTRQERQITISDALAAWLTAYPGPVLPPNYERLNKRVRKHFSLSPDEARHSFISYHVALHRSVGDAALQAGNSEAIVKRHYLNTHPQEDGAQFSATLPDPTTRRAVVTTGTIEAPAILKAV